MLKKLLQKYNSLDNPMYVLVVFDSVILLDYTLTATVC